MCVRQCLGTGRRNYVNEVVVVKRKEGKGGKEDLAAEYIYR